LSFFSCKSDKNKEIFLDSDTARKTVETEKVLEEQPNGSFDNEVTGDDPLAVFLGKWFLLSFEDGSIDKSNSYIEIYPEGLDYRFNFKYYGTMERGYLKLDDESTVALHRDDGHVDYIVGEPFESGDTLVFLVDSEGPLGFFQRE
jgi:hypothetical protein